jgi:polyferredoxin
MSQSQVKLDLLAARPLRWLWRSPAFPWALQVLALAAVLLLVANGLGLGPGMGAEDLMTFRKTNLTTLVVWGLWWPGMIAVALAFGRAWCTVCPMELVNRAGDAIARKVGWPRARLGKLLRAGWMIVVAYLALQLLVAGVSMHRVPHYTAILLLVLLGGALVTGLVFRQPRSFCKAFCPAGALLSVYGRYTPIQLEARDPSVCDRCPTRDCVKKANRYRFDKRSCPSLLVPFRRDASDGCVLCLQCAKVCPYDNMGVGLVSPDAPVRRKALLKPYEAAFVMVALGFVAHEVIGEVRWLDGVFHFVPERLATLVPAVPFGWFEALWFLTLFPFLVWAAIAGVGYLAGHRAGWRSLLLAAATGAAPIVAIAHLAKAVAKISSWGGFLPLSLRDPQGLVTYRQLADQSISTPAAMVGLTVLGWAMLAAVLVIAWRAWRWSQQIPAESTMAARVGLVGTAVLFTSVLTVWALPGL